MLEAALGPLKVLLKRFWPAGDVFVAQAPTIYTAKVTRLSPTCENGVGGVTVVKLSNFTNRTTLYIPESFRGSFDVEEAALVDCEWK